MADASAATAQTFYTKFFGWEAAKCPMEGMEYTVLKANDDATATQVEKLGDTIVRPPMDIPKVGRFCVLQDPQGATICAITYAEQPD